MATSPFVSLPLRSLRSSACALPLVINSALAGSNVAPAMPRPFKNERRLTPQRRRELLSSLVGGRGCVSGDTVERSFSFLFISILRFDFSDGGVLRKNTFALRFQTGRPPDLFPTIIKFLRLFSWTQTTVTASAVMVIYHYWIINWKTI
jgi:hypothetical protein